MAPRAAVVALALLGLLVAASAAPCIPCSSCKTNHCYSTCSKSCPAVVDGEKCKRYGSDAGSKIGKDACSTTMTYCKGGQRMVGSKRSFPVSLGQCENIAYGACQQKAREVAQWGWGSQCRWAFNGVQQCDKKTFNDYFNAEVDELCNKAAAAITNP